MWNVLVTYAVDLNKVLVFVVVVVVVVVVDVVLMKKVLVVVVGMFPDVLVCGSSCFLGVSMQLVCGRRLWVRDVDGKSVKLPKAVKRNVCCMLFGCVGGIEVCG